MRFDLHFENDPGGRGAWVLVALLIVVGVVTILTTWITTAAR